MNPALAVAVGAFACIGVVAILFGIGFFVQWLVARQRPPLDDSMDFITSIVLGLIMCAALALVTFMFYQAGLLILGVPPT
jgi:hypothetical protein